MLKQRNVTLDVSKGLILITLPVIHSVLFFCSTSVHHSGGGKMLALIAEQAAPVFMMTMGIAITHGKQKTARQILRRSLKLLLLGYSLNVLKFVIPALCLGLPESLFIENGIRKDFHGLFRLIIIGDILQLAAISYLICGFLYRVQRYALWAAGIALLTILFSPITWNIQPAGVIFVHPVALLNGVPPDSFFPVFPWMAYPISGLAVGYIMKSFTERKAYLLLSISGLIFCILGLIGSHYEPTEWLTNFYRLGPSGTCLHVGSALLFITSCHLITKAPRSSKIIQFLNMLSRQVTFVYMIQWILVCWLLPVFGYHTKTFPSALLPILIVTLTTIFLTYLYTYTQPKASRVQ
ncbi:heparan-alpha-glucosaminide N-acetyltransferase domain-containing protein [Arachidicoccus terrestris]|uniref:heparan-alpha-glucosaminide N-acetyltransferase domain-containing protein n=1 Tax=Arachidicoccus terrestris TaxID=2875539 RepID=UPI001CC3BF71|nr:heparan-alpha-glucosaminide N-acetyltransferase domain-containing protein [Arachidicoccus terrestris]UAY54192.1 DUF1624 domain-containing protein [Arachidicoccus terrestris]